MRLAEKFGVPLLTFVDTPGAYPGIGAEERGQSEAIGRNLYVMAGLRVPVVVSVIGEGGSGGALAIAVGDTTLMLQYSTYSVISPEGCAAILWKSSENAAEAADATRHHGDPPQEPGPHRQGRERALGGAHRDHAETAKNLKKAIQDSLRGLQDISVDELLERRQDRLVNFGKFKGNRRVTARRFFSAP
jgi:acetyl-CoA carboxylase carboxyl transferase subunit alpha